MVSGLRKPNISLLPRISYQGYQILQAGKAEGTLIGGNLGTLRLLQGTPYMPGLDGSILFLEKVSQSRADIYEFDRNLQALTQIPGFESVRGMVLGRFENNFECLSEK